MTTTRLLGLTTLLLATSLFAGACGKKGATPAGSASGTAPTRDSRLNEVNRFNIDWPLKSTEVAGAIAEVEAKLGPGKKLADGSTLWGAVSDATHCVRIVVRDVGGKLDAQSETILDQHPDFAACVAASK